MTLKKNLIVEINFLGKSNCSLREQLKKPLKAFDMISITMHLENKICEDKFVKITKETLYNTFFP